MQATFSKKQIEDRLGRAIDVLLKRDRFLLENDTNERSITHRLALYLESEFEDWDVDCEYNRNHDCVKTLRLQPREILSNDLNAQTVFPDVIVHQRNADRNLLVIEAKKSTGGDSKRDLEKLAAFKAELGYLYAVSLTFKTGSEDVQCSNPNWV